MADFEVWERGTLAAFAKEAHTRIVAQEQTIAELQQDIKMLLERVRELMKQKQ